MARPRRWLVLTVESPSAALNDTLAEGLVRLGGSAVQEEGLTLRTFLPPPVSVDVRGAEDADTSAEHFARMAAGTLAQHAGCTPPRVTWAWQEDEDWLARWRAGLAPRRVGERLIVAPTWTVQDLTAGSDDIVIAIDPQMAFGTGEHASTRGVLRLLERALRPGAKVLDVGSGSAILAIAAEKLGAASVVAVESDVEAIENAHDNLARNRATRVRLECALVDAPYLRACPDAPFELIVANVLRSVLEPLLPAFREALRPGGSLIIGGLLVEEAQSFCSAAADSGLRLRAEDTEEEWWSAWFAL